MMADTPETQPAPVRFTEWCPELERALKQPFPLEAHKLKDRKGTFVAYQHYVARLNDLVGPGGWTMQQPQTYHSGNKLGISVGVTILGVTRWNVGDEMEDHGEPIVDEQTGREKVVDFGSSSTNSWAQAFKRTCALFGLGLYLYNKEWTAKYLSKAARNGNGGQQQGQEPPRQQQRAPAQDQQDNGANSDVPPCPECNGPMFDNRGNKTNPKAPDFRCKDANCKDANGYRSALWADNAAA